MVKVLTNSQGKVYVSNGKALEAQRIAPMIEPLSVTPTTSAQTITAPSGVDGYSPINVAAVTSSIDNNIQESNIKSGVSILGVTGTVTELNGETRTETLTSSAGNTFMPSSGKNAITSITVTPNNQNRSVTPSTSSQTLSVNSGYSGNGTISVEAVTSSIDANIQAGNIKKDVQILGVTGTYEGSSGKYKLLDRVKDDNNVEIGTVTGFFTNYNNIEYAVVCLKESYISETTLQLCSSTAGITNLPSYNNLVSSNVWEGIETATSNTNTILNYCQSGGYTSAACNHCRQYSFVIDGTTYYGQLPNMQELNDIARHYAYISDIARAFWSSNAYNTTNMYYLRTDGRNTYADKTSKWYVVPVLEIPNQ